MAAPPNYAALVTGAGAAYCDLDLANDQPFELNLRFVAVDYNAAAIAVDVRSLPDIRITGTSLTVSAPTLDGADTICTASLSEAEVEALGSASEPGREIVTYYRVHVTPSGGAKRLWAAGKLTRLGS
jgi:hypothetical protein